MTAVASPPTAGDPITALLDQLESRNWGMVEGLFDDPTLTQLRGEILGMLVAGQFRPAGVGRGRSFRVDSTVRSDAVHWLDFVDPTAAQSMLAATLGELQLALNRRFYLGLRGFEAHCTVYARGSHYARHLDRFVDAGHRCVSFILYLNRRWSIEDGGQLRIFEPGTDEQVASDLLPTWGRAVAFFSDTVPHEVLVTRRRRLSITGWFRTDS